MKKQSNNLWLLTEERPKKEVIKTIIEKFSNDQKLSTKTNGINITPIIENNKFLFKYVVTGVTIENTQNIFIKIVSGDSSFVDFLVFYQECEPTKFDQPLYGIEETKTSDKESRNTGVSQRLTKFVYLDFFYPNCKKIMLYNIRTEDNEEPTQTNIFGTRILLTLGVEILGKVLNSKIFTKFTDIDAFINFKNKMRKPPKGNTPIEIKKEPNKISISGRLYKSGGLSHDPNIGGLSGIIQTLRKLGYSNKIEITKHGLKQKHLHPNNKFIQIANKRNVSLAGLTLPNSILPSNYWHYEISSQKIVTIFLHLLLEQLQYIKIIYENHAGSERGYIIDSSGTSHTVAKYIKCDKKRGIVNIPDLVIFDSKNSAILDVEGEIYSKIAQGLKDMKKFNAFEEEYVEKYYPSIPITRYLVVYRPKDHTKSIIINGKVILVLHPDGTIETFDHTPTIIRDAISKL